MKNLLLCLVSGWVAGGYIPPETAQIVLGVTVGFVVAISLWLLLNAPELLLCPVTVQTPAQRRPVSRQRPVYRPSAGTFPSLAATTA